MRFPFRENKKDFDFDDLLIKIKHCSKNHGDNKSDDVNESNSKLVKCMRPNQAIQYLSIFAF